MADEKLRDELKRLHDEEWRKLPYWGVPMVLFIALFWAAIFFILNAV